MVSANINGGVVPTAHAVLDGGDLDCGSGLLLIIRQALHKLEPGQVLELKSREVSVKEDLPAWCRMTENELVAIQPMADHVKYFIRRGKADGVAQKPDWGIKVPPRPGTGVDLRDWYVGRVGQVLEEAPVTNGFAPRGAVVERGAPAYPFTLNRKREIWAETLADLYEQAKAAQWDATKDIPWADLKPLPEELEWATCQLMTFLAENEFSALYIPAKFLPRINPHYMEVALLLASVMNDEARHIEVFVKRALANGGGLQYSAASAELSLLTLFEQDDYASSSFLLHVLGEGTFLDLLKFIEQYTPDAPTRELVKRARLDEARHVKYGIAHLKFSLEYESRLPEALAEAVEERAAVLQAVAGVNSHVQQALAILAGGGSAPEQMAKGIEAVKGLYQEMHENRVKRMVQGGLSRELAERLSEMHTPNFM